MSRKTPPLPALRSLVCLRLRQNKEWGCGARALEGGWPLGSARLPRLPVARQLRGLCLHAPWLNPLAAWLLAHARGSIVRRAAQHDSPVAPGGPNTRHALRAPDAWEGNRVPLSLSAVGKWSLPANEGKKTPKQANFPLEYRHFLTC